MTAAPINRALDFVREAVSEASTLWWGFFDWLALVEWRQLFLTWFLAIVFCIILNMPEPAFWYVLISFGVKVLAGGKRRAELVAKEATMQANVATLRERGVTIVEPASGRLTGADTGPHHDHQFDCRSYILHGGYSEEVLHPDGRIELRHHRPGDVVEIPHDHVHRIISLHEGEAITLYEVLGPKVQESGFFEHRQGIMWHRKWFESEFKPFPSQES